MVKESRRDDVFRRRAFQNRLTVVFEPRVTSDFPTGFIPYAEDDTRRDATARKITMKHSRALPTYGFEYQKIR